MPGFLKQSVRVSIGEYLRPGLPVILAAECYDDNGALVDDLRGTFPDVRIFPASTSAFDPITDALPRIDLAEIGFREIAQAVYGGSPGLYMWQFTVPDEPFPILAGWEIDASKISFGGWMVWVYAQVTAGDFAYGYKGVTVDNRLNTVYTDRADVGDIDTAIAAARQNRPQNIKMDFVRATVENAARKVAVGVYDHMDYSIKADSATDWTSPVSTGTLYFWYDNIGETRPIRTGGPN